MIGVGCITYNRPKHLELFMKQLTEFTIEEGYSGFIYEDLDHKGVAYSTNKCLEALKDCDHIFIFNDDCFPIKKGWEKVYIETGLNHLLYFRETVDIEKIKTVNHPRLNLSYPTSNSLSEALAMDSDRVQFYKINYFTNCGGCLMYITKEVIEKVGYLNKDYGLYGYEHAGYSKRIHKAGLTPHPYMVPSNAGEYIYSLDYDNYLDFEIDHKPSLTVKEAEESIKKNRKIFFEDIKTIYQPFNA